MPTNYIVHAVIIVLGSYLLGEYLLPIFDDEVFGVIVCALFLILIMVLVDYLFIGAL
jgi:hypothetical protein